VFVLCKQCCVPQHSLTLSKVKPRTGPVFHLPWYFFGPLNFLAGTAQNAYVATSANMAATTSIDILPTAAQSMHMLHHLISFMVLHGQSNADWSPRTYVRTIFAADRDTPTGSFCLGLPADFEATIEARSRRATNDTETLASSSNCVCIHQHALE
jgi:hypothetical protein